MKRNIHFLKKYSVSYEELMRLPNDACVNVNRAYFYYLMGMIGNHKLLKIDQSKSSQIFSKYIEIERMNIFLKGFSFISRYYLMTVDEIKYLINILGDTQTSTTSLLKSDMKASELEEYYNNLKERVLLKKAHIKSKKMIIE